MRLFLTGGILIEVEEDFATGKLTIFVYQGRLNEEPVLSSTDGQGGAWDLYRYAMYRWNDGYPEQVIEYNTSKQIIEVDPKEGTPYWLLMVYPLFLRRGLPVKKILVRSRVPEVIEDDKELWDKVQEVYKAPVKLAY